MTFAGFPVSPRMWLALGLGLAAAGGNVLGGLFVVRRNWSRRYLTYFLALGAGFMLAVSLIDMVPESIRLTGVTALYYVLGGYFLVHLFEHTIAPHFHFGEETHGEELRSHHASRSALMGLGIHTFFDGVAIGSGFLVSGWLGIVIFTAIVLHKLPEGFAISSLMLAGGESRRNALLAAMLLGVATVGGVVLMGVLNTAVEYSLPISAGVTLYVAASDLMPEVNREPGPWMAILVFIGVAVLFVMRRLAHI
jgi:ZIP family zinc transporter/zinc and cadmium transporter